MIDNDFHPDDRLENDADHGHWGTKLPITDAMPTASGGGRSLVEINNPELGPSDAELRSRVKGFEKQRRKNGPK